MAAVVILHPLALQQALQVAVRHLYLRHRVRRKVLYLYRLQQVEVTRRTYLLGDFLLVLHRRPHPIYPLGFPVEDSLTVRDGLEVITRLERRVNQTSVHPAGPHVRLCVRLAPGEARQVVAALVVGVYRRSHEDVHALHDVLPRAQYLAALKRLITQAAGDGGGYKGNPIAVVDGKTPQQQRGHVRAGSHQHRRRVHHKGLAVIQPVGVAHQEGEDKLARVRALLCYQAVHDALDVVGVLQPFILGYTPVLVGREIGLGIVQRVRILHHMTGQAEPYRKLRKMVAKIRVGAQVPADGAGGPRLVGPPQQIFDAVSGEQHDGVADADHLLDLRRWTDEHRVPRQRLHRHLTRHVIVRPAYQPAALVVGTEYQVPERARLMHAQQFQAVAQRELGLRQPHALQPLALHPQAAHGRARAVIAVVAAQLGVDALKPYLVPHITSGP